jgi:hypothetical protein
MTDPTRWRADPVRRPDGADRLLRGMRRPQLPGSGDLARLAAVVDDIPRRSAVRTRRAMRFVSAVAAMATLAALGTAVWAWRGRRAPAPRPLLASAHRGAAAPAAPAPDFAAGVDDAPALAPAPAPAPVGTRATRHAPARVVHRERAARPAAAAVAPTTTTDTLVRETGLIDAARERLAAAAPSQALAALETHRREFPRGQLAAEREFLAVEALRRLGRTAEARARAAELAARFPSSSYAARATKALQASAP